MPASGSEPRGQEGKHPTLYNVLCFQWLLYIVFSHPLRSTKRPSVSPASEKRTAVTTVMQLRIIAQLQVNVSVPSTFKEAQAKLRRSVG